MKKQHHQFTALLALCLLTLLSFAAARAADHPSESDKAFLGGYEKVRAALAADDLGGAKKAASELGKPGEAITKSDSLKAAREAFVSVSDQAVKAAAGQSGYYVVHCPMLKKDWVQTSKVISNPYGGKEMLTCGEIKG